MNIEDLAEDSDTSDEDYVPGGKQEDVPSEVDSDGDSEDPLSDAEDVGKRGVKRKKKGAKSRKKQKNESQQSGELSFVLRYSCTLMLLKTNYLNVVFTIIN